MRHSILFITISISLLLSNENTFSQCNVPIPAYTKTGSANLGGCGSNIRWVCSGDSISNYGGGSNTYFMESGSYANQIGGGGDWIYVKRNATLDISGGGGSITVFYEPGAVINNGLSSNTSNHFILCQSLTFNYANAPNSGCCHNYNFNTMMTISVCDSAYLSGAYQKQKGTYYDRYQTAFGCDSLVTTQLIVYNPYPYTDTIHVVITDTNYITIYKTVTDTLFIDVSLTTIRAANNINTIKIYPNPARTHIFIDNGTYKSMDGYSVKITNSTDQIVFETLIYQQLIYVDLSRWTGSGLYFLHLIDPQHKTVDIKKIVLQ
jgi:hypothetical protein